MTPIQIRNLCKTFGEGPSAVHAVDDISLRIESGEFFFLLGPSGCGKTTLLRMIAGLIDPSAGTILFGDRDVTHLDVARRKTALVFQNYALWPHMTVARNVQFGPKMQRVPRAQRQQRMVENLRRVEMEGFQKRKPNQLSGGQQQRVALARALAAQPECLLLDEPLSNLDARLRLHMRGELRRLVKSTGTTGVYVTHDQKEALSMADRVAVMNAGRIVQVGTPQALYLRPATRFVADFLGEANFIEGRIAQGGIETSAGRIALSPEADASPGQTITCCIRPEQIDAIDADTPVPPGHVALAATVRSVTFLGEIRQIVCRLEGGETHWRITSLARADRDFGEGQAIRATFPPAAVVLLTR